MLAVRAAGAAAAADPAGTPGGPAHDGRALYLQSCAACHGAGGHGDGPEASSFTPAPRDLTSGFLAGLDEERLVARLRDGTPLTLEPRALQHRLGRLEDVTSHLKRLPDVDWPGVDRGATVYAERCALCHGPFGQPLAASSLPQGVQKAPRDLRDPAFQRALDDQELIAAVQHGRSAMPAIPALRDPRQAADLVVFVRLLSPGFETYSFYCAPCHGDDGGGRGALATGANRPPVAFDRAWRASVDPEQLRIDVAHMLSLHGPSMPHLRGTLGDEQLRAIVRYLKSGS